MLGVLLFLVLFSLVCIFWFTSRQWWIKVMTQSPQCTYYFGPFSSEKEAIARHRGYLEDLEQEGAIGITYKIERTRPKHLTMGEP